MCLFVMMCMKTVSHHHNINDSVLYLYGCSRNYLIVWQKLLCLNALLCFAIFKKQLTKSVSGKLWVVQKLHECICWVFKVCECWQKLRIALISWSNVRNNDKYFIWNIYSSFCLESEMNLEWAWNVTIEECIQGKQCDILPLHIE